MSFCKSVTRLEANRQTLKTSPVKENPPKAQFLLKAQTMALMAKSGAFQLLHFHSIDSSYGYLPPICPKFGNFHSPKLNFSVKRSKSVLPLPVIRAQSSQIDYTPDSKYYKIEAILRPWRAPKVSSALLKAGIRGVTVSDVRGFGAQGGVAERHAGSEFSDDKFVAKVKMEIVVSKEQVEAVIDAIMTEARTGEIGDGKIFVIPIADIIRVRTGERGEQAERMSGGRHDMISNGS